MSLFIHVLISLDFIVKKKGPNERQYIAYSKIYNRTGAQIRVMQDHYPTLYSMVVKDIGYVKTYKAIPSLQIRQDDLNECLDLP